MLSEYDEQMDTVTQVIIDWFTKIIKTMPDFKDDQIYESTLLIDDKTPLPCIGFYRNRISPYEGKDLCIGREKNSFDFAVCYLNKPTSIQYYNNILYHFEENLILKTSKMFNEQDFPNHINYPYLNKNIDIEDIKFKSSTVSTIMTNGTNYNYANMVRLIFTIDYSIDLNGDYDG